MSLAGIESQGRLARLVNEQAHTRMSAGYIGRWMRGERGVRVDPETLFAVADVLGVRARWLWIGDGPMLQAIEPPPRSVAR